MHYLIYQKSRKSEIRSLVCQKFNWLGAKCSTRRPSGSSRPLTGGFNFCFSIYGDRSFTVEKDKSVQTIFKVKNPFKQFSGSRWGRISLRPRSKGRVWRARKVPLFANQPVSQFLKHIILILRARKVPLFANHPVSCILNTLSCDFYLKHLISCIALSGE